MPRVSTTSALAALIAVMGVACGGNLLLRHEPIDLAGLEPAEFVVEAPDPRDVRAVKVRVWVAPAVQAEMSTHRGRAGGRTRSR